MTEYSTRRRSSNSRASESENAALPSRIPVKSPARAVGGMAMAYSPIRSSPMEKNVSSTAGNATSDYSKKLLELKNAMDLLKTPPAPAPQQATAQSSQSQNSHTHLVSYTPIKSSSLAQLGSAISPFASSMESIEISMEESSSSDTEIATPLAGNSNNDNSLLDAYDDDEDHRSSSHNVRNDRNVFSSPTPYNQSTLTNPPSSPYISAEELKSRIEATREAFQRSLEAQKRRLRTSIAFQDIDSSFSTCGSGFDSDLSVDSLRDTKNQLERIKKEAAELIESDLEEVESIRSRKRASAATENNLIQVPNESWTLNFFKFLSIFTITSIIFTFLFINYAPNLSSMADFVASFDKQTVLERLEETLNFLLQD